MKTMRIRRFPAAVTAWCLRQGQGVAEAESLVASARAGRRCSQRNLCGRRHRECDTCGRQVHEVWSCGRDACGAPDAPDCCIVCKNGGWRIYWPRKRRAA